MGLVVIIDFQNRLRPILVIYLLIKFTKNYNFVAS